MKDVSDFHEKYGADGLNELLKKARRPFFSKGKPGSKEKPVDSLKLPPIVSASDLLSSNPEVPPELMKGLLHQSSKMVLGGGSKSFKTWSLLDLALSVAAGQPWWGFDTTASPVLYINLELPDWSFAKRISDIKTARPELALGGGLDIWNLRGKAVSFDQMRPEITRRITGKYGLIVIDPIYKVYGDRDENSAGDMGSLLNEIERLAVETGAAVVFGAHFSKGNQAGKESIDRISGSGVFARDPDTILVMTKHENEDTFTVEATLRNFKPIPAFCVRRNHPLMERDDQVDPSRLKQPGFKVKYTAEQLLEVLGSHSLTTTAWFLRTSHKTGMCKRTFMEKLKELKKDGTKIFQDSNDLWNTGKNDTKK